MRWLGVRLYWTLVSALFINVSSNVSCSSVALVIFKLACLFHLSYFSLQSSQQSWIALCRRQSELQTRLDQAPTEKWRYSRNNHFESPNSQEGMAQVCTNEQGKEPYSFVVETPAKREKHIRWKEDGRSRAQDILSWGRFREEGVQSKNGPFINNIQPKG